MWCGILHTQHRRVMDTKTYKVAGIVILLLIGIIVLYPSFTEKNKDTTPITIGFIGPLTGDTFGAVSERGQNAKAAVEIAAEKLTRPAAYADDRSK